MAAGSIGKRATLLATHRSLEKVRQGNFGNDKNGTGTLLANPDCPQSKTTTHSMEASS